LASRFPRPVTAPDPTQAIQQTLDRWQQYHGYALKALQSFRTALQQIAMVPTESVHGNPARLAAVLQHNMAQLWRLLGQNDEAHVALQRALTLAESFYLDDLQWKIRLAFAELHPAGELTTLQEAIRDLEKSPAALALAPYNHTVLTLLDQLYGRVIALLIQEQGMEEAYIYAERWQAQRLLVHLGPTALHALPFSRDLDQALSTEVRELVGQLRTVQKQLATPTRVAAILALQQALVATAVPRPGDVGAIETEPQAEQELRTTYKRTLSSYQGLLDEMQQERPELAALFTTTIVEPVEIQELLRPDSLLIKYTLLPGQLIIWAIDQRNFHPRVVPIPATQLTTILARLRTRQPDRRDADMQQLATWLVEPIAAHLRGKTRLYILPDTRLLSIPWAGLKLENGVLVDNVQMSVVHSGHHLLQARDKGSLYHERLLVLETDQSDSQGQEPAWYQAAREAVSTVTLMQPGAISKTRLLEQIPNYDLVHLNAPTVFNSVFPLQSALHLSSGTQHASRLEVREFYGLQASANLMILTQTPAESPAGLLLPLLDQSLLFAGFAAVLVRHGQPDATYDRAFLTTFYRHLPQHSVSAALRLAQLDMQHQYPQHDGWAQFQLYGYQGMDSEEQQEFAQQAYPEVLAEAGSALQRQAWEEAATTLERAARLSMMLQTEALPVIYQRLTEAYRHLQQYDHAIAAQMRLLQLLQEPGKGTPAMEAEAYHMLGILYSEAEAFLPAVHHLQRAVALQQEHGLTEELTHSYITLGIAQERGAAYQDALQSFQHSLEIHQDIGSMEGVGEQLRRLGRIALLRLNNYAAAKDYFERALQIFTAAQNEPQIVQVLLELCRVYQQWSSFAQALDYCQQAAEGARSQEDQAVRAQIHIDFANTYWLRGDYQNAFNHQRQGARLAQEAHAGLQRLLAANTLGLIYWTLNDPQRARQQQQEALQLARELKLKHEEATVYNNIGIIDRQQKRYDDALQAFERALTIDVALKSRWGQGHAHRNLGMTYLHKEDLDRAHTHLQQAVSLSRTIGDRTNTAKALLSLGDTALQRGDLATAQQTYQETLTLARTIGLPEVEWRALYAQGRLARMRGQAQPAI
ncbi:MAG: tetratricopeptide repeat protein, partial [Candidatus Tectomicrobia bacterium]